MVAAVALGVIVLLADPSHPQEYGRHAGVVLTVILSGDVRYSMALTESPH